MNNHISRVINSQATAQARRSNTSSNSQTRNNNQTQSLNNRISSSRASIENSRTNNTSISINTSSQTSFTTQSSGTENSDTQNNNPSLSERSQEEANFSDFKTAFYKNQNQGLHNLLDQWVNVIDDTGSARANMAQIRAQINLVNSLEDFWSGRGAQWKEETEFTKNGPGYAAKDKQLVEDTYKKLAGLENLYDQWGSVNDNTGIARANTAELRTGIKYNQAVLDVLKQGKGAEAVDEQAVNEASFAGFKSEFYTAQGAGLENLIDQWAGVSDSTGFANEQITLAKKQLGSVNDAKELYSQLEKFWDQESSRGYSADQKKLIDPLHKEVIELSNKFDQGIDLGEAGNKLNKIMTKIENIYQPSANTNVEALQQGVNPKEEKEFAALKIDFYKQQHTGLLQIKRDKQGGASQSDPTKPQEESVDINKQLRYNNKAKDFWKKEHGFWNRIDKAGESTTNQAEIQSLMFQLTTLENQMDQNLNDFGNRKERKEISKEITAVKSKIRDLHSNLN